MKKVIYLLLLVSLAACSCPNTEQQPNSDLAASFDSLAMSRRSIRQFAPASISRDTLDRLIRHGINAPNGCNLQAYELRVVDDAALLAQISDAVKHDNPEEAKSEGSIFFDAQCVIFIANDTSYDMSQVDCGLLGENVILSAWSLGIGSCCMAHPVRLMKTSPSCAPCLERLGFSQGYNLLYCIALGYPQEQPEARPRKNDMASYVD